VDILDLPFKTPILFSPLVLLLQLEHLLELLLELLLLQLVHQNLLS
jgi:hypothetical protein